MKSGDQTEREDRTGRKSSSNQAADDDAEKAGATPGYAKP